MLCIISGPLLDEWLWTECNGAVAATHRGYCRSVVTRSVFQSDDRQFDPRLALEQDTYPWIAARSFG